MFKLFLTLFSLLLVVTQGSWASKELGKVTDTGHLKCDVCKLVVDEIEGGVACDALDVDAC